MVDYFKESENVMKKFVSEKKIKNLTLSKDGSKVIYKKKQYYDLYDFAMATSNWWLFEQEDYMREKDCDESDIPEWLESWDVYIFSPRGKKRYQNWVDFFFEREKDDFIELMELNA